MFQGAGGVAYGRIVENGQAEEDNNSHLLVQAQRLAIRCAHVEGVDGHLGAVAACMYTRVHCVLASDVTRKTNIAFMATVQSHSTSTQILPRLHGCMQSRADTGFA